MQNKEKDSGGNKKHPPEADANKFAQ